MKHFITKKRLVVIVILILFTLLTGGRGWIALYHFFVPRQQIIRQEAPPPAIVPEPWITVFVHGSFCSVFGLLNVMNVVNDDVEGTDYKRVVGKMRQDPFFYQEQSFMERGLLPITPTYDLDSVGGKKYGAYPLIKAYEQVLEWVKPNKQKNYFYTFGWSGLISQRRRRKEAVRFYNQLSDEVQKLHDQGIQPKVCVLTHSHGGNLVAYLTAIDRALFLRENPSLLDQITSDSREEFSTLLDTKKYIDDLPEKDDVASAPRQKKWDYRPLRRDVTIDELILWGMPVQPETDYMLSSSIFNNVYHCYSDEDLVQRIDWVSTKKHYSDRRLKKERVCSNFPGEKGKVLNHITQVRFMVGRKLETRKAYVMRDGPNADTTNTINKTLREEEQSIWRDLFMGGSLTSPRTDDPTHRELWFFTWHLKKGQRSPILAPLPLMVFSPLFVQMIKTARLEDVDINLVAKDKIINVGLVKHAELLLACERNISRALLDDLTQKVEPWKSKDVSSQDIFNLIRRYADEP